MFKALHKNTLKHVADILGTSPHFRTVVIIFINVHVCVCVCVSIMRVFLRRTVCVCLCVFLLVHAFAWNIQHFVFAPMNVKHTRRMHTGPLLILC